MLTGVEQCYDPGYDSHAPMPELCQPKLAILAMRSLAEPHEHEVGRYQLGKLILLSASADSRLGLPGRSTQAREADPITKPCTRTDSLN